MPELEILIELGCQSQDADALKLLLFPQGQLRPPKYTTTVESYLQYTAEKKRYKDISEFVRESGDRQFNGIEVDHKFRPYTIPGTDYTVVWFGQDLELSPTNSVWLSVSDWPPLLYPPRDNLYLHCGSREYNLKYLEIKTYPTLMATRLGVETSESSDQFEEWLFQNLHLFLPNDLLRIGVFGSIRVGPVIDENVSAFGWFWGTSSPNGLHNWPGAFAEIGDKFHGLYPILIGNYPACRGLRQTLGKALALRPLPASDGTCQIGMLRIPDLVLTNRDSEHVAKPWLVTKDSTTAWRPLGSDPGMVRMGRFHGWVQSRYEELRKSDRLWGPQSEASLHYYPVISDAYCAMAGIDRDIMIVKSYYPLLYTETQARIDAIFAERPDLPMRQRVWTAHSVAWAESVQSFDGVDQYVHDHFFPEL
jgi:hypothetical protein